METTAPIPARSDRTLLSKADALAKMTVELNLRVVSAQAERLEREIKELVACTAQDRQFRKKNEERMTDMMREIWSIKLRMDEVAVGHTDVDALFTRCQRETEELRLQLRADVDDLRKQIDEALSRLDSLPCPADVEAEVATGNRQSLLAEATSLKLAREDCSKRPPHRRVAETIRSTRRWHRDLKKSTVPESQFVLDYLKQQLKRDPDMAVFIQQAMQKRLQRKSSGPGTRSIPRSLEEFCKDARWMDVVETVQATLMRDKNRAIQSLQ
ncbi:hypothetical protein RJ55_00270 [Drechmeria coniospora]|nr:hypothetical protein RJ55_00270 [Drechmeria coniospora]